MEQFVYGREKLTQVQHVAEQRRSSCRIGKLILHFIAIYQDKVITEE